MSEGFTESVTFKAEGLDAVVQAQNTAAKSAAELAREWAAGQAVLSRKTSGGFVADLLKHAKAADEFRKASRRPSPVASMQYTPDVRRQERAGFGGGAGAAASRMRDETASAMKAAAMSIKKSFAEGRKAWNAPPPEHLQKVQTRGQIAMSRAGNAAATVGAGITAFGMSGFGGTVQGNRAQAEWELVQRELAAAFLPALEYSTKGLQKFRHFLEGLNSTGQNIVAGVGMTALAHVAARQVVTGGLVGVAGGAASAAGWAGRRVGIGGAAVGAAGAAGIAGVAAAGLPTAAAMAGVGTPGATKKAMDMGALAKVSARGGSMNMAALSAMSAFPSGFPAQARGANANYSASRMNMAALSAVAQPVAPPVASRYAQLRSGIGGMAGTAGAGIRAVGGAVGPVAALTAGVAIVGGFAGEASTRAAAKASEERRRRIQEGRLDESEVGGLEESAKLAIQRNGGTEEDFRAKVEKDRVEFMRRQYGDDAEGNSIGTWSKLKAVGNRFSRNLGLGGDLDAEDAKVRGQLEQADFLNKKKTGDPMIGGVGGGKDRRRLEIAGGGFESFTDTYQRTESAFGAIMGANAGGPQAGADKDGAIAKALADVAIAVKALADEQAKQKANEPGQIMRNA